ncbi:MAG: DUF4007 family protein [Chloroflexia bacterium]|nr:DUF4007 family protein [Chloroflexia bacterium]
MRSIKFHQRFKPDRARLAAVMRCMAEHQVVSKKMVATYIGAGEPAAEGSIGWLFKTGLGETKQKGYGLTQLGALIAAHDPELAQQGTLWLMHYYLVTDQNERAEVWYRAFNEFLSPGMRFLRASLQTYVERSLESSPTNKSGVDDDCQQFVKGYVDPAALGKLDLIREVEPQTYEVSLNRLPECHIFAFALFNAWERRFPHTDTLRISQICEEAELPGRVFAAQRDQIVALLQMLQSLGLVTIIDSQHEPVTRRYRDEPIQLLKTFYATL